MLTSSVTIGKKGTKVLVSDIHSSNFRRFGLSSEERSAKKSQVQQELTMGFVSYSAAETISSLTAAKVTAMFDNTKNKAYISQMEVFSDVFEYKLNAGKEGKPYMHRRGQSLGYYPARIIGHLNSITENGVITFTGRVWEIILPFKDVGDKGRIYVPAGINHCGIEKRFVWVMFGGEPSTVVEKVVKA